MLQCNSTLAELRVDEDPLWPAHSGITFHELGLGLSILFGLASIIVAFYLIYRHATHYLVPSQQKHIIRILLMIPIYSTVSFLSVLYYQHAVYYQVLRDCYEAFAISSFFALMCEYVAPGLHEQKKFFRTLTPVNWFWGVFFMQKCTGGENRGPFRKPRSGLTWFNVVWAGIFQYCLVRVMFTIVSVVTEVFGRYCEHSLNPAFAHVWVAGFESASVTVAMFCLVQFYIQLKEKLGDYRPALKIICIKLVIFFSFWQSVCVVEIPVWKMSILLISPPDGHILPRLFQRAPQTHKQDQLPRHLHRHPLMAALRHPTHLRFPLAPLLPHPRIRRLHQ
jgi:hypothetical protein